MEGLVQGPRENSQVGAKGIRGAEAFALGAFRDEEERLPVPAPDFGLAFEPFPLDPGPEGVLRRGRLLT